MLNYYVQSWTYGFPADHWDNYAARISAVTPQQAEVLLFARTSGTIDVVLRSPQDTTVTAVTDGVILKTLIDKYGVIPPNIIVVSVP